MPTRPKYTKILKLAVGFFIATTAIFLLANFTLAATDVGLDKVGDIGLSNAVDLRIIIARIIRIFIGLLGILSVCLIIYGGFIWMTSAGDEQKIEQAKTILKNAVIGLIIILLAFAIASFILNMLTGATTGGPGGPGGGAPTNYGLSALGNGIIQSHYPTRGQKEVPRNTSIIITFREPMLSSTLCQTADTAIGAKCSSELTNQSVIKIFKQSECPGDPASCTSLAEAKVYTTDGKTFVFIPINYLGSPSEYINYTVYLGNGLKRQSGCQAGDLSKCDKAFPGAGGNYGWSFEVSNKIDLTPPQVQSNGVFPRPDNLKDTRVPGAATRATGSITVNSRPAVYRDASVLSVAKNPVNPPPPWGAAAATVNKNCNRSGEFIVSVDSVQASIIKLTDSNNNLLGQGVVNGKTVAFTQMCNLNLTTSDANFFAGNSWKITVRAMTAADTITVGNITYTASNAEDISKHNFEVSKDENTANSIANVLENNPEVIVEWNEDNKVSITAKLAGAAGNSINLSTSNPAALAASAMLGGRDNADTVTVRDKTDQPMNSALQINFNEAIMPLTVSGTADEVKNFIRVVNANPAAKPTVAAPGDKSCTADADCLSYKCEGNPKICVANELQGKFAISNQYSTVEFLSDKECGYNNCGEKIYCLPANSHLRVELKAASLISCANKDNPANADNSLCVDKSPFNTCDLTRKFCRDNVDSNKYFPQADKTNPNNKNIVDGITDAAFNSLDGNRNDSAYGPDKFYNENAPVGVCESGAHKGDICTEVNKVAVCGQDIKCFMDGDNYKWSFFISNILDLTPPKITATDPILKNTVPADLIKRITISFNKVMLSSRLTTGSLTVQNGKQNILHYLLNLRSLVDQPLGYWVTNVGRFTGNNLTSTDVSINHSPFSKSSTYNAQAGSGLKDIYQNCFLPCSSESLTGNPSCCNGAAHNQATCP